MHDQKSCMMNITDNLNTYNFSMCLPKCEATDILSYEEDVIDLYDQIETAVRILRLNQEYSSHKHSNNQIPIFIAGSILLKNFIVKLLF